MLGFAASGHPLTLLRPTLPPLVRRSDQFDDLEHGADVQVAGLVVARVRPVLRPTLAAKRSRQECSFHPW